MNALTTIEILIVLIIDYCHLTERMMD